MATLIRGIQNKLHPSLTILVQTKNYEIYIH